ncbi:MAG: hypothetical protein SXG53_25485 [Pseudomonadota bacterium]|nr:hypothetical protein [Pseudomonadota bacterium]
MTLNVKQKVAALVLGGLLVSQVQAQAPDIPANVSGTYTLTYDYASAGSPFTNGTVKTFVLDGAADTMCVDGVSLGTGYFRSGSGSEMLWSDGAGTFYALSLLNTGGFSEINVYSPSDAGNNWKGQFPGPGTYSSAVNCSGGSTPAQTTLTTDQEYVIGLAAELYPDLFTTRIATGTTQGYTYAAYNSGVHVGFKDGNLFVTGGPWGSQIQNMGTVSTVTTKLTNAKNSLTVTPTADMNSLFTYAAQVYPNIFTNGTAFKVDAYGYLYKYFADSGVYAAIKNGAVYVRGGAYGNAYTSVGALNSLLGQLQAVVNGNNNPGGGTTIPSGNYNLTVSGTVTVSGFAQAFSYSIAGIPAPDVSDHDDIEEAFVDALGNAGSGITITQFSYDVVSSTANLVEFNVTVAATISTNGFSMPYSYNLNYRYTK